MRILFLKANSAGIEFLWNQWLYSEAHSLGIVLTGLQIHRTMSMQNIQ